MISSNADFVVRVKVLCKYTSILDKIMTEFEHRSQTEPVAVDWLENCIMLADEETWEETLNKMSECYDVIYYGVIASKEEDAEIMYKAQQIMAARGEIYYLSDKLNIPGFNTKEIFNIGSMMHLYGTAYEGEVR